MFFVTTLGWGILYIFVLQSFKTWRPLLYLLTHRLTKKLILISISLKLKPLQIIHQKSNSLTWGSDFQTQPSIKRHFYWAQWIDFSILFRVSTLHTSVLRTGLYSFITPIQFKNSLTFLISSAELTREFVRLTKSRS